MWGVDRFRNLKGGKMLLSFCCLDVLSITHVRNWNIVRGRPVWMFLSCRDLSVKQTLNSTILQTSRDTITTYKVYLCILPTRKSSSGKTCVLPEIFFPKACQNQKNCAGKGRLSKETWQACGVRTKRAAQASAGYAWGTKNLSFLISKLSQNKCHLLVSGCHKIVVEF